MKIKIGKPNKTNASRTATLVRDRNSLCIYDVHIKRVYVCVRERLRMHFTWPVERYEIVLVLALYLHVLRFLCCFRTLYSLYHFIPCLSACPVSLLSLYRETKFLDSKSCSKQMLNYSLTRSDITTKWKKNYADSNAML